MNKKRLQTTMLLIFSVCFLTLSAQNVQKAQVNDILKDPNAYNQEEVEVSGLVIQYIEATEQTTSHYYLKDDFGAIIKIHTAESKPETNEKYTVRGILYIEASTLLPFISEKSKIKIAKEGDDDEDFCNLQEYGGRELAERVCPGKAPEAQEVGGRRGSVNDDRLYKTMAEKALEALRRFYRPLEFVENRAGFRRQLEQIFVACLVAGEQYNMVWTFVDPRTLIVHSVARDVCRRDRHEGDGHEAQRRGQQPRQHRDRRVQAVAHEL